MMKYSRILGIRKPITSRILEIIVLNALALFSVYEQKLQGDYINVVDMPFDVDWHNLGSGTVQSQSSYYKKISMLSYVARINYAYKGKYMLTVSSRWDGSSKFQKDNRWGSVPLQLPWHGAFPMKILWDLPANG